jgi:hypothetical protein
MEFFGNILNTEIFTVTVEQANKFPIRMHSSNHFELKNQKKL